MTKLHKSIIFMLYIFTIVLIFMFKISRYDFTLYVATIFSIIYLFYYYINCLTENRKVNMDYDVFDKILFILVAIYVIMSILTVALNNKSEIVYNIVRVEVLFVFVILIKDFYRNLEDLAEIKNYIAIMFIFCAVISLVLYFKGYSQVFFSVKSIVKLIPNNQFVSLFGEKRLHWTLTHKSRFAVFCITGLTFLLTNNRFKKRTKVIFSPVFILCVYLSNSKVGLLMTILFVAYYFKQKLNKKVFIVRFFLVIIVAFIFTATTYFYYKDLSNNRNISTFGSRKYIWTAGMEFIKQNPNGIGKADDDFSLDVGFEVTNLHNIFLNECLERGTTSGILYLIIWIIIAIRFLKYNNKIYFSYVIAILGISMFDNTISSELSYIFWFCLPIFYLDCKKLKAVED